VQGFTVLRDRAARNHDTLLGEMRESDSGVCAFSAATSCLIRARIAVEEAAPPVSVATWLPKKYFSS
jgi:hypothetical protein